MTQPRIVIIGGGFGGAYCAQTLERKLPHGAADTFLLDRNNYFAFYPMLMEAGTGNLEPRHAVVPIRSFLKRTIFRMGEVETIDFDRKIVHYRLAGSDFTGEIAYDHLVLAIGSITRWLDVPGLRDNGYQLKTLDDAVALRDRAILLLEWADAVDDPRERRELLHFVVVGGNFTGVEVAGELDAFVQSACREYRNVTPQDCSITVVDHADRLLTILDKDLSDYTLHNMRKRGMDIRLQTTVTEVQPDTVTLSTGEKLKAHTLIWCAGVEPNPLARKLGLPTGPKGHIICERDMRVQGYDNVWAIGDCASIPDAQGNPYPPTAQHAVQQAYRLAKNLAAVIAGRPTLPATSSQEARSPRSDIMPGSPKSSASNYRASLRGFLWRTVYLMKMPGLARKAKVTLDWTLDLLFPHDHVVLGIHRHHQPPTRDH